MISQPIASVIVPAFNAEAGLARALDSACRQTLAEIEVIVVDDGSRDRTKEVAEHWRSTDSRVRLAAHPQSRGPSAARNTALREATGRWIVLLDADDAMEPSRVARLIREAETRKLDVLADNLTLVNGTKLTAMGCALNPEVMARPGLLSLPELLRADWPGHDVAYRSLGVIKPVIRRAFLTDHAIGYDESIRLGEDLLFYSRLIAQGARFGLTGSAGYFYTTHVQTLSRRRTPTTELVEVNDKIRLEAAALPDPDGALAALLDARGRALRYQVLTWALKTGDLRLAHDMATSMPPEALARLSLNKLSLRFRRSRGAASPVAPATGEQSREASPVQPRLSLVIATLGRVKELDRLLTSLAQQSWRDFDVTLVDQNGDGRLNGIASASWPFAIQHLRTPDARGACRARNTGWRATTGQVVLFPDDDCWYPPQFLASGLRQLQETGAQILAGRAADNERRSINGRFELRPCSITRANVWTTSIEWVAFFDRIALETLGGFDEGIGIGAQSPWQSCESQDIVLRALEAGIPCGYDPELFGHHEELNISEPDAAQIRKGRAYARGMGWVLRKHRTSWPRRAYWIGRPVLKCALRTLQRRSSAATYYREIAMGRLEGACGRLTAGMFDKT